MQQITLLDGVNEVLMRARKIDQPLTSMVDPGVQTWINIATSTWNDAIMGLQKTDAFNGEVVEGEIVLKDGDALRQQLGDFEGAEEAREYDLPEDFVQMRGKRPRDMVFLDQEESRRIYPYPGEQYADEQRLFVVQSVPEKVKGFPTWYVILKTKRRFRLDKWPGAEEAGKVYKYRYERSLFMRNPTDKFPFHDQVIQALFESVAQGIRDKLNGQFNLVEFENSVGQATAFASQREKKNGYAHRYYHQPPRKNYSKIPTATQSNRTDWVW